MTRNQVLAVLLLVAIFSLQFLLLIPDAHAQSQDLAEKKGLGGVFNRDAYDETKGPTKAKLALTLGATIVMVAVLKYA